MKYRKCIRGISCFACAAAFGALTPISALAASPPFAYTEEKWATLQDDKLEFDEIADLVHEYNSTVEQNQIEYKDYKGKDSSDIAEDYYDTADEIESSIEYPDSDDANYGSLLASAQNSEASAQQMREMGDDNVTDDDVMLWGYTQTEKSLVQSAQQQMIEYWNAQETLKNSRNQAEKAQKDYETASLKAGAGSATQSDLLNAQESLLTAQAAVVSAQNTITTTKESLCLMLGWDYGSEVEIGELPKPQESMSASVNLEEDIAKAVENNYQLKIYEREAHNAMTSTLKEQYQNSLSSGTEAVKSKVKLAYQTLLLTENQYEQAKKSLELAEKQMQSADRKIAAGTISQTAYQSEKYSYDSAVSEERTAAMSLLEAQLSYEWAVNGLASAT